MSFKNCFKNISLTVLGCIMALVVLELLLRVYNPLEIRFKPDRIVLPVNKRYIINNAGKFTKLPPTTIHTKNSLGFRGAPPPADFKDDLTIVTIGGSTTECFYLSDGRTWPDLLGQELSRDFKRVWINNAGLDGATTYRHIILMEDYLIKLRPKVVLFLTGINDVGAGNLDATGHRGHYLRDLWRAFLYRSEVYSLEQNLYHYLIAQSRGLRHDEINLSKVETLDHPSEAAARQTLQDYRTHSLPFFAQRLERLIQISRAHGIEPVLITQPTLYGPGVDPVTGVNLATLKVQDRFNGQMMFDFIELYNEVTRQVAQKHGVLLIDLARELPRNSAYYYDYLHYTEPGAAAVAAIVDRHLTPWLAQRYPAFRKTAHAF
ncbi:MAG: SGNH/GDSL hydrolase family protein [Desulfobaccales bacterium]